MLTPEALDQIFLAAHTANGFRPEPVPDELLHRVWDIAKMGPTSLNCSPARIVFVRSPEGKERLRPAMSPGNLDKTMAAPCTAIIAWDTRFFEHMPRMFAHRPEAKDLFAAPGKEAFAHTAAFRNGSMQGGYFILAARAVGLDCGPMSGFDNAKVDAAFFADGRYKSNFLCNLGKGDASKVMPRLPRLAFEEACTLA